MIFARALVTDVPKVGRGAGGSQLPLSKFSPCTRNRVGRLPPVELMVAVLKRYVNLGRSLDPTYPQQYVLSRNVRDIKGIISPIPPLQICA